MHVDNEGIVERLWKGERKFIDPKVGDADLWIKIWYESHLLVSKEILVKVEHVKAHRTKKDKHEMSRFEKFVAEGNVKANELAKTGATLDEWFTAEGRAETVQHERERRRVCSFALCSQFSLLGGGRERLRRVQANAKNTLCFRG